ncbi:MAG: hypothetical protein IT210_02595 [Armatimonadetes bacterium]|nr:hypothetical protein [Armatimonadota bacterium]
MMPPESVVPTQASDPAAIGQESEVESAWRSSTGARHPIRDEEPKRAGEAARPHKQNRPRSASEVDPKAGASSQTG